MPDSEATSITVRVRRGTRNESYLDSFRVPLTRGQSVLGALQYIYDNLDPTLAFAGSCRIGMCVSCMVRVNGKVVRGCTTLAESDLLVEPAKHSAIVRDLITE